MRQKGTFRHRCWPSLRLLLLYPGQTMWSDFKKDGNTIDCPRLPVREQTAPEKRICVEMPHIEREALGEFFSGRNLLYNAEVHNDENHSESRDTNIDIKGCLWQPPSWANFHALRPTLCDHQSTCWKDKILRFLTHLMSFSKAKQN